MLENAREIKFQEGHMSQLKTAQDVRCDFSRKGIAIAKWAKKHGLRPSVVYDLLNQRTAATRGMAHKAAVLLGMKDGEIDETF